VNIFEKPIIVLDIETTGLNGMMYSVCELAAMKLDEKLNKVDQFHTEKYIKPFEEKYLKEAMETHGINKEILDKAPGFESIINDFIEWCGPKGESELSSWGISFDFPFMQCQFYKMHKRWPFDYRYFDLRTVVKYEAAWKGYKSKLSLRDYCDIYKVEYDLKQYHTAIGDVEMEVNLFKKVKEERDKLYEQLYSLQQQLRDHDYHKYMD